LQDIDKPWKEFIEPINNVYSNKMKSSVTHFTPTEARNQDDLIFAKLSLELHNKQNRGYPKVNIGDNIKSYKETNI